MTDRTAGEFETPHLKSVDTSIAPSLILAIRRRRKRQAPHSRIAVELSGLLIGRLLDWSLTLYSRLPLRNSIQNAGNARRHAAGQSATNHGSEGDLGQLFSTFRGQCSDASNLDPD